MTAAEEQALARLNYETAAREANSWARIIANDVAAAESDWSKLPTPKMLQSYRDAVAAEAVARAAWDRADAAVAS